jgi:hypothetical protein
MTYTATERQRATAWKSTTDALPAAARGPAGYGTGRTSDDFCLPPEHAVLNLLPEVREQALALFTELGIPWHASVGGGPSNHLLSSQVQCVNALGQIVSDPPRIVRAFGELLQIDEVLQIEPGRHLTFEYIGPSDFFGEAPGAERTRGARCTSIDAAFLHRRRDSVRELVLLEWKYTESYGLRRPEPEKDAVRCARYGAAWEAADSPVRNDLLPLDLVLDEPFYQLVRQQLLAHELETARAHGAESVRVLHVLPRDNEAYQQSLVRAEHRALGGTVSEVWQRLLRRPDRFVQVDPAVFLDPLVTSEEYVRRYG